MKARAVYDAAKQAGATDVDLVEEPMAAAVGAGLPVWDAAGSMVVDVGGGTSEVAVISLGDIVTAQSVRIAGDDLDEAIIAYVRKKHNLLIGERTAEQIKIDIGSAKPYDNETSVEIKGRNQVDGLPKNVIITSEEVRNAMADPISQIIDTVRLTLEKTPPELAADIIDRGITLTAAARCCAALPSLSPRKRVCRYRLRQTRLTAWFWAPQSGLRLTAALITTFSAAVNVSDKIILEGEKCDFSFAAVGSK